MMKNHLCCSALILLTMWGCGGSAAVRCRPLLCPAGLEPSQPCQRSPAEEVECRLCPGGTFSEAFDSEVCRPHTSCEQLRRSVAAAGTPTTDAVCGDCLPGFLATSKGKLAIRTPCDKTLHNRVARTVVSGPADGAGDLVNGTLMASTEEKTTEYAVFALVPVFCIMGLLGILICNILKKKGYKCSAEKEGGDEENATPQKEGNNYPYIADDLNEDTISVLVRIIAEKKENAAALEELLLEYENKQMAVNKSSSIKFPLLSLSTFRPLPKLCPHQSHLHTISGLSGLGPKHGYRCTRCAQKKWPAVFIPPLNALKDPLKPTQTLILPSLDKSTDQQKSPLLADSCADQYRTPVPNSAQEKVEERDGKEGELKVLSVGRFQVAQIPEYKPVAVETKKPPQTKRNSLFGGLPFSSSSSIWR
ncbi:tumor necrosis factor receptor superfamily member 19L [Synchiropus splendidus]|uniref:tumor necrosis factor receptor superfamily member 19L n=1 Tax=Synchiropus splendidus TaxID=270530 RepID=UPI00237D593B|nr:tumor necrosis factor receptor superfamily member 19L [Synchiropus splendidus]XP_053728975.1 tumor necrosis factor receptor superfamily member 19L [Synchiropus splendidus]XP_053728976.1 tumor necrosis factor receptor superfamily member 19L [Synchiropus splendidus]